METINIFSIMTIAFFGSFGHCIGMCGGIVIAYTGTKVDQNGAKQNKQQPIFSTLLDAYLPT
jgi:sulfite exporter TauE/SafE